MENSPERMPADRFEEIPQLISGQEAVMRIARLLGGEISPEEAQEISDSSDAKVNKQFGTQGEMN